MVLCLAASMLVLVPASAPAALINPTGDAGALGAAMSSSQEGLLTGASFVEGPSAAHANGVSAAAGHHMPTSGADFAVLTTGDVALADPPNNAAGTTRSNGTAARGVYDPTILKVDVEVPQWANCIGFDFVFYSEEFPEYVGSAFNDAFVAQLDRHDWSYDTGTHTLTAPGNFAFGTQGEQITVNTAFETTADTGLEYDGATVLLRARTPVTPGSHSVYFTIFDAGDAYWDSAVFIDDLRVTKAPAGECKAGARPVDSDGDGIPDDWESNGLDVDGDGTVDLDLAAMGASPLRKDVFVHLDQMQGHGMLPKGLDIVIKSFLDAPVDNPDGSTGISLHVDNGPDSVMNPLTGQTWGELSRQNSVQEKSVLGTCTDDDCANGTYDWSEFDAIKAAGFPVEREPVFRYALMANQFGTKDNTITGISRGMPSSDFMVTLGGGNPCSKPLQCAGSFERQAGTFMHELGHSLGLRHGGHDHVQGKPNYLSVMNYHFQFAGIPLQKGKVYDYSRFGSGAGAGMLAPLAEGALNETAGVAATGIEGYQTLRRCGASLFLVQLNAPADWNCNGVFEASVAADINGDGTQGELQSHDDWSNLAFRGGAIGGFGLAQNLPESTPPHGDVPFAELEQAEQVVQTVIPDEAAPTGVAVGGAVLSRTYRLRPRFRVHWTATDAYSGVGSFAVTTTRAPFNAGFRPEQSWRDAALGRSSIFTGAPGNTHCFRARATDVAGNTSDASSWRCVALPVDSVRLNNVRGWRHMSGTGRYLGTYVVARKRGSVARLRVRGARAALVATTCRRCGTVDVLIGTQRVARVRLTSAHRRHGVVIPLTRVPRSFSGVLRLRVVSDGRPVMIEGIGISAV